MQRFKFQLTLFSLIISMAVGAQENQTIFNSAGVRNSGGYGALANKFTSINGMFANVPEIYGGWFINKSFLLGFEGAASTNYIPVPLEHQDWNGNKMTYQYGQFGLMTEYVIGSYKKVHANLNLVSGAGFVLQYDRDSYSNWHFEEHRTKSYFFMVLEPGIQLEFNLLDWMRFSPGISYRRAFGSGAPGLTDDKLSGLSGNLTMKFGHF